MARERYQRGYLERVGKRTKNWRAHWYVYAAQPDGSEKRVHKSRVLGPCARMTKSEAQQKLDQIIAATEAPTEPTAEMTVADFAERVFLPSREGKALNTRRLYGTALRAYILPRIGTMPLSGVRKMHVVAMAKSMADEQYKHGTVGLAIRVVHAMFEEALDNQLVESNPVRRVENPVPKPRGAKPTLRLSQVRELFSRLTGRRRLLFRVLILCGLRIGEALALRWNDLRDDGLMVDEAAEQSRGKAPKQVKTGVEHIVPLSPALRAELIEYRSQTFFARADDYIFGSAKFGRLVERKMARKIYLLPARRDSGLGDLLTFRVCRRTLATLLKEQGVATVDTQAILGHATAQTTETHYIQPVEESQRRAIEALDALTMVQ